MSKKNRVCKTCGKPLPKKNNSFCNKDCQLRRVVKICKECGKELPITHRRRYCDWKCLNHYRRDRGYFKDLYASKHPEREKKKCILCGDLILFKKRGVTRKNVSKFCSKWCMQMSVRILKGQKNMYIKVPVTRKSIRLESRKR